MRVGLSIRDCCLLSSRDPSRLIARSRAGEWLVVPGTVGAGRTDCRNVLSTPRSP
jgi:hypothetical protein